MIGYASTNLRQETTRVLRPHKVLRQGSRCHPGNLVAITQSARPAKVSDADVKQVVTKPHSNTIERPVSEPVKRHLKVERKSNLALAIIGLLSTGALVAGLWPTANPTTTISTAKQTEPTHQIQAMQPEPAEQPQLSEQVAKMTSTLEMSSTMEQEEAEDSSVPIKRPENLSNTVIVEKIPAEFLVQRDWLVRKNKSLQEQVDSLSSETMNLNQELLRLELEIASLEAAPTPEIRTVYNYVNVPIGSDFAENKGYGTVTDARELVEENQTVNYSDDSNSETNIGFDNQTGVYYDQGYVANSYQYEQNAQVAYDENTGYYVNPNYAINANQGDLSSSDDDSDIWYEDEEERDN